MLKNVAFVKYSKILMERNEVILKEEVRRLADFSWNDPFMTIIYLLDTKLGTCQSFHKVHVKLFVWSQHRSFQTEDVELGSRSSFLLIKREVLAKMNPIKWDEIIMLCHMPLASPNVAQGILRHLIPDE